MKKVSKNIKETTEIAKTFLDKILKDKKNTEKATIVCLSGNLGAGKTAFTQGVAKHLGVKSKVVSPTFVIYKKYPLKNKKHKYLFHLDAYRLKNEKELLHLDWNKIVSDNENLVIVEWPENVKKVIPKYAKYIYISNDKNDSRILELK
ncbi:MAG: tRNA (adenosine(37)-N6)-threonylcarbamoyltransferase complex ATPase subunit type 1 TsaE [Candidatus Paceibacterota bacterium]|jgi:tRNA threonylcarbamoyladenosine biosynthesis protein TsaE